MLRLAADPFRHMLGWISVTAPLSTSAALRPACPSRWRVVTRWTTCSTGVTSLGCAEVLTLDADAGRVDLPQLLAALAQREFNELHVEAGARLNGAFVRQGLVDEWLVYQAPAFLGQGRGMAELGELGHLSQAERFHYRDVSRVGDDLRILARSGKASDCFTFAPPPK